MRKWALGLLLVAGAVALVSLRTERPRSEASPAPVASQAAALPARPAAPPPSAGPSIRGTVVDLHGRPAAGVRVSASVPEPGETLSELPCPPELQYADGTRKLPDCFDEAGDLLLELASARQGEAPVHSETTTAADGTFTLGGLPEGPQVLWALGEEGAVMRSGVPADTEGVELTLEQGHTLTGTVSGEGAPLAGVRVTAVSARHTRFFDATTGADGQYHVGPLPRGAYALLFTKEEWLPVLLTDELTRQGLARTVTLHRPRTLTGRVLASGAPAPGVQVLVAEGKVLPGPTARSVTADAQGRFTLVLPSVQHTLSATSGGQSALARVELEAQAPPEVVLELGSAMHLSGQVRDEARRPLAGARVKLEHPTDPLQRWETGTDEEGRYAFGPLEPGHWYLGVQARRYQDVPDEPYPLTADMGPLDFTLARAPSVEGRVTDTAGLPLANVGVRLVSADEEDWEDEAQSEDWTDEEGRFVLDAGKPGAFLIELTEDRYVLEPVPVRVPSRNVQLTVRAGGSILGTLMDARGLPLEGFEVKGVSPEPEEDASVRVDVTDARGRFSLQGLKRGAYRLLASQKSEGVVRKLWREVELREEAPLELELRLPEEYALSGVVVDTQGRPPHLAHVRAWLPTEDEPEWVQRLGGYGAGSPDGVRADPDGRFTLRHLTGPRYHVRPFAGGYTFLPERSEGGQPRDKDLEARPGAAGVRLVMKRQPHLTGRVVGPDGAPLTLVIINGYAYRIPKGRFWALFSSESAPQSFIFSAEGMSTLARDVVPRPGEDVDLGEVRLKPGSTILGRVVDARTNRPLPNVLLSLTPADPVPPGTPGRLGGQVRTDAEGGFEMTGLAPGQYTVDVLEAPGYQPQRVRTIPFRELTLPLEPAAP